MNFEPSTQTNTQKLIRVENTDANHITAPYEHDPNVVKIFWYYGKDWDTLKSQGYTGYYIDNANQYNTYEGDESNAGVDYTLYSDWPNNGSHPTLSHGPAPIDSDDLWEGMSGDDFGYTGAGNDKLDARAGIDTLVGGEGDDSLDGGDANDYLYGDYANWPIYVWKEIQYGTYAYVAHLPEEDLSLTGNDTLSGDSGNDYLNGGPGDDTLEGGGDQDTLEGGPGQDDLQGNSGNDSLDGGADNDKLNGNTGIDTLTGGSGADTFVFSSTDGLIDTITDFNAVDNDTLNIHSSAFGVTSTDQLKVEDDGSGNTILSVTASGTQIVKLLKIKASSFNIADSVKIVQDNHAGNNIFQITAGDIVTITNFQGVGTGTQITESVLSNADTLQFMTTGLTAETMQLTQIADDLEITFLSDVTDTKVLLKNVTLENFDNLLKATGANTDFDNVQFVGDALTDSIDVFNLDSKQRYLWNRNTVTFLNDLDNRVKGFSQSDDVINGQGGHDILHGRSGDDILRGGEGRDHLVGGNGDDELWGNNGDDILQGDIGNDIFVLAPNQGKDVIKDFTVGQDLIGLTDGLSFGKLTLTGDEIRIGDQTLAVLEGSNAELLTESSFAEV